VYDKTGRAVQVSLSDEVVLSVDVRGATTFLLVACRAWNTVSEALRPRCVSLMDTNRADWYVRLDGSYLSAELENATVNLPHFQLDSSYILHSDTFYPGYYALESLSFPYWYVKALSDGRLGIVQQDSTTDYYDAASFRVYDYNTSSTNVFLLYCAHFVINILVLVLRFFRIPVYDPAKKVMFLSVFFGVTLRNAGLHKNLWIYVRENFVTARQCNKK